MKFAGSGRSWLAVAALAVVCESPSLWAQAAGTPAAAPSSQNTWKQTPEGRAAAAGNQMDCSGSVSSGPDGTVTTTTTCPTGTTSETTPKGTALPGIAAPPVAPAPAVATPPKSPAQQFPYPGSETPASQAPATAPVGAAATDSNVPAGKRFPFPGEAGSTDAGSTPSANNPGGLRDAGSSGDSPNGNSSSSSSSSSSSADRDPTAGPLGDDSDDAIAKEAAERRARKRLPKPTPKQTDSDRADEDVRVAGFYQNDGNFRAAYLRGLDAVSLAGDDAGAHLAVAEAARKLGKLDEALTHYKRCLALDPLPKQRKAAELALKQMSGGA